MMLDRETHKRTWENFIRGDEQALLEIYQQHYLGLMNYGRMFLEDREQVNDCFIEMLIRLWERRTTLPAVENVRSYLMTSFRRMILDRVKADAKRATKHSELQHNSEDHQQSYEDFLLRLQWDQQLKTKLENALTKLTERQLQLVRMKFFEDLDYDEIAERCGITKRTAYNIIYDAISTLKKELNGDKNLSFLVNLTFIAAILSATSTLKINF